MVKIIKSNALNLFPAFRYPNYRIFFMAQIIALTGHWMQQVAQGYLAYQLTGSALWVGIVMAVSQLPSTIFALIGGTIVDRFPKKNIFKITQTTRFILSVVLGLLIVSNNINLYSLCFFSFLIGLVMAVDQPARLSLPHELVEKKDLHSAIAMNMSMFNSARIVGPAIAGWLIVAFGVGWAYLINGLSLIAPIIAFNFITFRPHISRPNPGTINAIKEGLKYAFTHVTIKYLLIYLAIISIFGWSYTTILPVMAETVFQKGAQGLGLLFSAAGLGSVIGALSVSAYTQRFDTKKLILFGGLLYGSALIGFSLTHDFYLALGLLFLTGFGLTTQNSTIQATIQHAVDDRLRGRVSSIQSLMLMGMHPVGSLQVGAIAQFFGSQIAIGSGGLVIFLAALILYYFSTKKH